MIVLDASAAVDVLLRIEPEAGWVAAHLVDEREWHAPELVDAEVLQALRRHASRGALDAEAALAAMRALVTMPLRRYPHLPFVPRAWELRAQMTPYDALYVALAEALDASIITTDRRLARAIDTVEVIAPA